MSLIEAIKICFIKFADFSGSATRSEFWYFSLFVVLLGVIATNIDASIAGETFWSYQGVLGPAESIYYLTTIVPSFSVSVRRLHDIGRSGWWVLIFLTIIGIFLLIYWACLRSEGRINKYGEFTLKLLNREK